MAELQTSLNINYKATNTLLKTAPPNLTEAITQATAKWDGGLRDIGLAEEDLVFTDIATPGMIVIQNVGNNDIDWGPKSAGVMVPLGRMKPGHFIKFYFKDATVILRMIAITAASQIQFWVYNT